MFVWQLAKKIFVIEKRILIIYEERERGGGLKNKVFK